MKRPVIIGEVLFDVVPGKEILGGAHFNVAWHLHALGLNPLLISRIGDDARGEIVLKTMREWGMDTSGIQIDTDGETTTTDCTVIDGKATYGICMGKAFDFIDAEQALNALGDSAISILFYGTLASRHAVSLAALEALVAKQPDIQFIDLNLRPPSYTDEQNQLFMQRADWLKLNDEELELISGQPCESRTEQEQAAQALQQQYAIENVLITCGEAGAFCVSNNGILSAKPEHDVVVADTIGAGDSFSSIIIAGKLLGWTDEKTLQCAVDLAAITCTQHGAVITDKSVYEKIIP